MSFSVLGTGVSALRAAQRQLEGAAHNVANVNTPGYSRQRVELVASRPSPGVYGVRGDGQRGTGVTIADVIRVRSALTDAAFRSEASVAAGADARAEVLARAEQVLGPVDAGLPSSLAAFWDSWDQLAMAPEDPASRQGVLDASAGLAAQVRSAAAQLGRVQDETFAKASEAVGEANRLAGDVAALNTATADALVGQQSPNDLMDQRDVLVDRLVALTGGTVRTGDLGSVDVYVGTRAIVRGGAVDELRVSTGQPAAVTWAPDGVAVTAGGRLGALVELSRQTLPGMRAELDAFATGLRDLLNTAHAAGFDQDGNPGGPLFAATSAADLAVAPGLTARGLAASAGGQAADGNNALAVGALRTAPAVGTSTLLEAVQGFAGRLGSQAASAQRAAATAAGVMGDLEQERAEQSSVSIDEEMVDIVRFQHAYEAAARVVTAADEMLDRLINNTGLVGR